MTCFRLREVYLKPGGAVKSSELFRRFRGRDPSPYSLLHQLGINNRKKEDYSS